MRTILIHLNVQVPDDDPRDETEITAAVCGAISVGQDDNSVRDLSIGVALHEEI